MSFLLPSGHIKTNELAKYEEASEQGTSIDELNCFEAVDSSSIRAGAILEFVKSDCA